MAKHYAKFIRPLTVDGETINAGAKLPIQGTNIMVGTSGQLPLIAALKFINIVDENDALLKNYQALPIVQQKFETTPVVDGGAIKIFSVTDDDFVDEFTNVPNAAYKLQVFFNSNVTDSVDQELVPEDNVTAKITSAEEEGNTTVKAGTDDDEGLYVVTAGVAADDIIIRFTYVNPLTGVTHTKDLPMTFTTEE